MRAAVIWRVGWTAVAVVVVEAIVCGLAAAPAVLLWLRLTELTATAGSVVRIAAFSVAIVPSYILFAVCLMVSSACATRMTGARTSPNTEMRIADMDWRLMSWARYTAAIHVVRILAGTVFRGSPVWTAYLRFNGARMGRRVYVNTTSISDHNLLECGDDVVIGADVHISGHTVERGIVKTAAVRLGRNVTIGLDSVVDIDVEIGDACEIGALSLVPKHARLEPGAIYAGIPVRRIGHSTVPPDSIKVPA
jgi:acetyltransferase-like isoleucine patch superfamily enzyme